VFDIQKTENTKKPPMGQTKATFLEGVIFTFLQ